MFDEHLFFDKISSVSKPLFVSFAVSVHTSIPKQLAPSPLPLFTPSSTTATLYHNLPKSQIWQMITRHQQIQNSLARAVVKAPKSSHITPILRSLHWLKVTERIEYKLLSLNYTTQFSQPPELHICITSSQFSLFAALALHLWSRSSIHVIFSTINRSFFPVCWLMLSFDRTLK